MRRRIPFRTRSDSGPESISTSSINWLTSSKPKTTRQVSGPRRGRQNGMILPDVNVLVHAHNPDFVVHGRARLWWDECLSGPQGVGLAWAVLLGFIRLTTNRKIVAEPLAVSDVMGRNSDGLNLPHIHLCAASRDALRPPSSRARTTGYSGKSDDGRPSRGSGDGAWLYPLHDRRRLRTISGIAVGKSMHR